jgi:HSP20 family molecular chaperone IbpA
MANQTGAAKAKENEAVSSVFIEPDRQQLADRLHRGVAQRAFELYSDGGGTHGNDLENWLRAESEMLSKVPEIRELSLWFTVNIRVAGFAPADIKVAMDEQRGIVAGEDRPVGGRTSASDGGHSRDSFFLIADWPSPVDPATATAYIKNETLTLTVKRAAPGENKQTS